MKLFNKSKNEAKEKSDEKINSSSKYFSKEPYRSIINLLAEYSNRENKIDTGLEPKHFRYILINNNDKKTERNPNGLHPNRVLQLRNFFDNDKYYNIFN